MSFENFDELAELVKEQTKEEFITKEATIIVEINGQKKYLDRVDFVHGEDEIIFVVEE